MKRVHSVIFKGKYRLFLAFEWFTIFKAMDQVGDFCSMINVLTPCMIKQLLNKSYSASLNIVICQCLTDLLTTDKLQYFAQPHPLTVTVTYFVCLHFHWVFFTLFAYIFLHFSFSTFFIFSMNQFFNNPELTHHVFL